MSRVYFVRHGEGQDNVARKFSSTRVDSPLTERGRLQARQTAEYLAGKHIDAVYCSPMKRAHETAQIIAGRLDRQVTVMEEFRELNVGDLEGQDFNDETWAIYHHVTNHWYAGNATAAFPGGEDYHRLWERMRTGLIQVVGNHSQRHSVLVGHGGIFAATLKEYCPGLELSWLQNVEYYHCAITELELRSWTVSWRARSWTGQAMVT